MHNHTVRKYFKLLFSIALCEGVGGLAAVFTISQIPIWYATLIQPAFAPPNWIFGPVWNTLYATAGISMFLIWQSGLQHKQVRFALILFLIHLAVNFLWSVVFFSFHSIGGAAFVIVILWAMIVALIALFWQIRKTAAWLLVPYLLWVTFATILNFSFLMLN